MTELTDLEICKKIAEIENLIFDDGGRYFRCMVLRNGVVYKYYDYNPLTDKALLWDLMAKYRVEIDFDESFASTYEDGGGKLISYSAFDDEVDLPRAVLLAIIEAHSK